MDFCKELSKASGGQKGEVESRNQRLLTALGDCAGDGPDMEAALMYVLKYLK